MSERDKSRPEPEIIPPGHPETGPRDNLWQDRRAGTGRSRVWQSGQRGAYMRVGRPGPLGIVLLFAAIGALGALGFFVFLGALAITIPIVAALVIAGLIGGILRRL